jgi:hypothetical protein
MRTIGLTLQPMITGPLMIAGQIPYTDMTPLAHLINEYVGFACGPRRAQDRPRCRRAAEKGPDVIDDCIVNRARGLNHLATVLALKAAGVDIKRLRVM